jgi:hypothetical protein
LPVNYLLPISKLSISMYLKVKMPQGFTIFCKWLFVLAFALFAGCSRTQAPEVLLSEDEMVEAIIDMYLFESKIIQLNLPRDSAEKIFEKAKPELFQKIGITDSAFRQSLDYYMLHSGKIELIYSRVVDSLTLKEQKLNLQVK